MTSGRDDDLPIPAAFASAAALKLFLSEHFARETDPARLRRITHATIGRYLGVSRVAYGEIDAAQAWMEVAEDWTDGVPSRTGRRPFDPDSFFGRLYREGRTLVVANVEDEPFHAEARVYLEEQQIRAFIGVPLIDNGRLVAVFNAVHHAPRRWQEEEIVTVAQTGARLWSALQHLETTARLRESEAQFRTLAENIPGLCWLAEVNGAPIWGNKAWHAFFDGTGGEFGDPIGLLHPDEATRVVAAWSTAIAAGTPLEMPVRMRGRDGLFRPFLSRAVPIRGEDGRVLRWCGTILDLTIQQERERRDAFLMAWSDDVRAQNDPGAILAMTLDRLGRHLAIARANYAEATADGAALCVLQEWRDGTSTVIGESFPLAALGDRIRDDHLGGAPVRVEDIRTDARCDATNRPMYEAIGVRAFLSVPMIRDGAIAAVLSVQHSTPRPWSDGDADLIRELADRAWAVVERARAEQRRAESEALLAAFMDNAPLGMHLKDAHGRYLRMNPELARQIGIPEEIVVGRAPEEFLPDAVAQRVTALEEEALAGRTAAAEFDFPDRTDFAALLAIVFPIDVPDGGRRTGGFTIDLTERKRAAAALAQSRETLFQTEKLSALGSLLAGVSHELNNPLSIVVAQSVMLERQSDGALAERAQKIRRAAERCAKIVQTFLAMARQKHPERRPVDLNAIVVAAHELADYGLRADGIVSTRELAADLPRISADADQLHQIVVNLVINAQQAMAEADPAGRRLVLRTGGSGQGVFVEVEDNGPGVPEDARRRIFEPFFTTKPQGAGTGVGLSFSQGLAEAHGGRLELLPSAAGARFRLTLPVDQAAADDAPDPASAPAAAPRRRALVVDDDRDIAESLADILSLAEFDCTVAIGGGAAIERLRDGDYDLVLSDLRMPGIDGAELHAWITANRPDLLDRIAFSTGDTLGTGATRFLEAVRRPVLEKPFTPEAVDRLLAQLADGGASLRA